ncbi:SDR family NAD(P)-dependent oxidoreductase [Frigoribacterium salinisoli]
MPKTIVITGASDGIGASAARTLHELGHEVVVVGRSPEKTRRVADALGVASHVADFSRLDDVRELAEALRREHPRIDVLANNAGGVFGEQRRTVDGHETTFQVNHLAGFLLTDLLLDVLVASRATVVQTSSIAARLFGDVDLDDLDNDRRWSANKAYGDSKLENQLFTRELQLRHGGDGITAASFHPGIISSGFATGARSGPLGLLYRNPVAARALGTPATGARQLVRMATEPSGGWWQPGEHHERQRVATWSLHPRSRDGALASALWERSAELVGRPLR